MRRFLILISAIVLSSCTQYIPVDNCPTITNMDSWQTVEDLYIEYMQLKAIHNGYTRE